MKNNQKGFSVVEILIVLAVVGLIGGVGWYVWQSKSKNDTAKSTQSEPSSTVQNTQADEQSDSSDFLILADFNAKIPLDDKTNGIKLGSVRSSKYNDADKSVPIIAPQLDTGWKCDADPTDDSKRSIGTISVTTQAERSGPYEPLVTKKVGKYTFGLEQGGSICTDSPEYQKLVDAFKIQFEKIEAN